MLSKIPSIILPPNPQLVALTIQKEAGIFELKELSIHLTKILSAVKEGQQKYCETVYTRSGIQHTNTILLEALSAGTIAYLS
jgi:hypothetical protein